jgi:hypothetical protein
MRGRTGNARALQRDVKTSAATPAEPGTSHGRLVVSEWGKITWHLPFELREIAQNHRHIETSEDRFLWLAIEQDSKGGLETTLRGMLARR